MDTIYAVNCYDEVKGVSEFITGTNLPKAIEVAKTSSEAKGMVCKVISFEGNIIGKAKEGKFKGD